MKKRIVKFLVAMLLFQQIIPAMNIVSAETLDEDQLPSQEEVIESENTKEEILESSTESDNDSIDEAVPSKSSQAGIADSVNSASDQANITPEASGDQTGTTSEIRSHLKGTFVPMGLTSEPTPDIKIDYEQGRLTGFETAASYELRFGTPPISVSGVDSYLITDDMYNKVWSIVRLGDNINTQESKAQQLTIKGRQQLYDMQITVVDESEKDKKDGQLKGVTLGHEYRKEGETSWTKGSINGQIKDLESGKYEIRYAASNATEKFASNIVTKTIAAGIAREETPNIGIDYEQGRLTGFEATASYELRFGTPPISVSGADSYLITDDMYNKVWSIVRLGDNINTQESKAQQLTIKNRQKLYENQITAIDESEKDKKDGQLKGVTLEHEYRKEGATSWNPGSTNGQIKDLESGKYEIRYAASNAKEKFASNIVTKTINAGLAREETPNVGIDYEQGRLTGFEVTASYELRFGTPPISVSGVENYSITEDMYSKGWNIVRLGNSSTTQESQAQQLTIKGRQKLYDMQIAVVDESEKDKKDGQLKGVTLEHEYRKEGATSWTQGSINGQITDLGPGKYEIRYAASNAKEKFASNIVTKIINAGLAREETPNVGIDYEQGRLTGFEVTASYELRFGQTIIPVSGVENCSIPEDMYSKGWNIVRLGNSSTTQESQAQQLTIKGRQKLIESSIIVVDESEKDKKDGQLKGVTLEHEYRKEGATSWTQGSINGQIKDLESGKYEIRYAASNAKEKFASNIVTKTIAAGLPREETPNVGIDYEQGRLTGFETAASYELRFGTPPISVSGVESFQIAADMHSKVWNIVRLGDNTSTQESQAQQLTIKGRQQLVESSIIVVDESEKNKKDGQLKGVTLEHEYRKEGSTSWTQGNTNGQIKDLESGKYEIRYAASNAKEKFASNIVTKTINAGLPREETPNVGIDYERGHLTGFETTASYELRFGNKKIPVSGVKTYQIVGDMYSKVWNIVRLGNNSTTQESKAQELTIKGRQQLVESSITVIDESEKGKKDGQLKGVSLEHEYCKEGATSWIQGSTNGQIKEMEPGKYEIRYAASNAKEKFASNIVTKTIAAGLAREETPKISIDYEQGRLTGFETTASYELRFGSSTISVSGVDNFQITADMHSKVWNIVRLGDNTNTQESQAQQLTIKGRQQLVESSIIVVDESEKDKKDGQLKGVSLEHEYRKEGVTNWTQGSANGQIKDLEPGKYEIRYAASNAKEKFASNIVTKTIAAGLAREETPKISIDYEQGCLTGFETTASYELRFGLSPISVSGVDNFQITADMHSKVWNIVRLGDNINTQESQAQKLTIKGRQQLVELSIIVVDESEKDKKDGQLKGVSLEHEYRKEGSTSWTQGSANGQIKDLEPGKYEIRYAASNAREKFASNIVAKTIAAGLIREELPELTIDYGSEQLLQLDPTATYELKELSTTKLTNLITILPGNTSFSITDSMLGKKWSVLRKARSTDYMDSQEQTIYLDKRSEIKLENFTAIKETQPGAKDGKLQNIFENAQYRKKGDITWQDGTAGGEIEQLEETLYEIRYKANAAQRIFASKIVEINLAAGLIQKVTPEIKIDYEREVLYNFLENEPYKIATYTGGKWVYTDQPIAKEIPIKEEMLDVWTYITIEEVKGVSVASKEQRIKLSARQTINEEAILAENTSHIGAADGKLFNVFVSMEYRKVDDKTWNQGTSDGTITNLTAGNYEIRYTGSNTEQKFASRIITKEIKEEVAKEPTPKVTINYENEALENLDAAARYRIATKDEKYEIQGKDIHSIDKKMFGKECSIVRTGEAGKTVDSDPQLLTIKARPILEESSIQPFNESGNKKQDGQLKGVNLDMEYRAENTKNWLAGTAEGLIKNLPAASYEIRYVASNVKEQFASLSIKKTIGTNAETENEQVLTKFGGGQSSKAITPTVSRKETNEKVLLKTGDSYSHILNLAGLGLLLSVACYWIRRKSKENS
nr:hypothetical protein [Enterococcus sp. 665A]MBO1342893.1 hypothetical protein [Enterococcus sp. 665A]